MVEFSDKEWFKDWFDTDWYHLLYKDRDWNEAGKFIATLMDYLKPTQKALILDAACGSGRHSIHLNHLGFDVRGFDLSANSIATASQHENDRLKFTVADLREYSSNEPFDIILNLFTSFGYFNSKADNVKVLSRFYENLKPKGTLVIDFFNINTVRKNLVEAEEKVVEGHTFSITREITNDHVIKNIELSDQGEVRRFQERVSAFTETDLIKMVTESGFSVTSIFGDYNLTSFDVENSPRLIIIAEKK